MIIWAFFNDLGTKHVLSFVFGNHSFNLFLYKPRMTIFLFCCGSIIFN